MFVLYLLECGSIAIVICIFCIIRIVFRFVKVNISIMEENENLFFTVCAAYEFYENNFDVLKR